MTRYDTTLYHTEHHTTPHRTAPHRMGADRPLGRLWGAGVSVAARHGSRRSARPRSACTSAASWRGSGTGARLPSGNGRARGLRGFLGFESSGLRGLRGLRASRGFRAFSLQAREHVPLRARTGSGRRRDMAGVISISLSLSIYIYIYTYKYIQTCTYTDNRYLYLYLYLYIKHGSSIILYIQTRLRGLWASGSRIFWRSSRSLSLSLSISIYIYICTHIMLYICNIRIHIHYIYTHICTLDNILTMMTLVLRIARSRGLRVSEALLSSLAWQHPCNRNHRCYRADRYDCY